MALMKMFWGKCLVISGMKRVLIHRDGTINKKDLDKLTIDELMWVMKRYCSGRVKDALIKEIMRQDIVAKMPRDFNDID